MGEPCLSKIKRMETTMSKNKKKKKSPSAEAVKPTSEQSVSNSETQASEIEKKPKERLMVRAIRVTPELLDAAKAYKKASGKSFYALGLEAISERLVKEGFLKESSESKN